MCQQSGEHLIETQCLRAVIEFQRQQLTLPIQLKEHVRLVSENVGFYGLVNEVNSPAFISLELPARFARPRRDEYQRDVAGTLAAAQKFGEFETIHVRHLDVQKGQRHIMHEEQL